MVLATVGPINDCGAMGFRRSCPCSTAGHPAALRVIDLDGIGPWAGKLTVKTLPLLPVGWFEAPQLGSP
jgi:hypothetical protein